VPIAVTLTLVLADAVAADARRVGAAGGCPAAVDAAPDSRGCVAPALAAATVITCSDAGGGGASSSLARVDGQLDDASASAAGLDDKQYLGTLSAFPE
jgi:hypothetical protein